MHAVSGITRFLRSVDRRHRFAAALTATTAHAVVAFCAVWVVDEVAPGFTLLALVCAVIWLVGFGWLHYRRGGASIARLDAEFGLRDGLRTWVAGVDAGPMADWLEQDLDSSLATLPPATRQRTVRARLRPLRYLVPVLLALWILRWLQPDLEIPGLRGGGGASAGVGESPVASSGDASPDTVPDRPDDSDRQQPPDAPPPDAPEPDPPPDDPPPQPDPKRLVDRPIRDDFVVPQFVGSGPSRLGTAHVANVGGGGERTPASRDQGGADPIPPSDPGIEFGRAAERALRSRHVAADERAVVRRYFELLLSRGRDR